jgi:cell division septation protein DedD
MPTGQQDTEITLGMGRMLALFFAFVLVCAFFFGIGFSLGKRTAAASGTLNPAIITPTTTVRPSPVQSSQAQPKPESSDFGFYKAVGEKTAGTGPTTQDSKTQAPTETATAPTANPAADTRAGPDTASAPPPGGGYYVQVAAVSRQEDAEALVEALKKKQYPAFTANNPSADKFYHVQVGPYADLKEAESMRARLISDGYNPIVKR